MADNKIFFETVVQFLEIGTDGLIETEPFLNACRCIVQFILMLGKAFRPVKTDIEGNINKLEQIYLSNVEQYKYLNSIVKIEKETLPENATHLGTERLLWLNRALKYNHVFLSFFLEEYKKADTEESLKNLSDSLKNYFELSYELTLKKHHNWVIQKIFACCLMVAPSRTNLLDLLGYSKLDISLLELRTVIINTMENYLKLMQSNTDAISILLLSVGQQP